MNGGGDMVARLRLRLGCCNFSGSFVLDVFRDKSDACKVGHRKDAQETHNLLRWVPERGGRAAVPKSFDSFCLSAVNVNVRRTNTRRARTYIRRKFLTRMSALGPGEKGFGERRNVRQSIELHRNRKASIVNCRSNDLSADVLTIVEIHRYWYCLSAPTPFTTFPAAEQQCCHSMNDRNMRYVILFNAREKRIS